jgi:two-component system alkaline phosphatase synthesis response regulator PhoP
VVKKTILLIEDEPGLVLTLRDRLVKEGYEVETAAQGEQGLAMGLTSAWDLIILDLMLPGKSGFDICRDLRQHRVPTPILMLTARDQVVDKVVGLKLGADDYLTKPFDTLELLARIEALLRRTDAQGQADSELRIGALRIDLRSTSVWRDGERVELSAREFELLRYFAAHPGETISRETLLKEVWGYAEPPTTRTVDVHVVWLRQKLEANPKQPELIQTVPGFGYRFGA